MKIKKILMFLLFPMFLFLVVGCNNKPTPTLTPDSNPVPAVEFNVKFYDGETLLVEKKVQENKSVSFPDTPTKDGYNFIGWFSDTSLEQKFDINKKITTHLNLYAKFELKAYVVKFLVDNTVLEEQTIKHNELANLPSEEPKKEGFNFVGWYVNKELTQKFDETKPITKETSIYAKFKPIVYNVTFYNGVDVITTKEVEFNNTVSLPNAPEKNDFNFVGWYSDNALTTAYDKATKITGDTDIYAKYLNNLDYFIFARANTVN